MDGWVSLAQEFVDELQTALERFQPIAEKLKERRR